MTGVVRIFSQLSDSGLCNSGLIREHPANLSADRSNAERCVEQHTRERAQRRVKRRVKRRAKRRAASNERSVKVQRRVSEALSEASSITQRVCFVVIYRATTRP